MRHMQIGTCGKQATMMSLSYVECLETREVSVTTSTQTRIWSWSISRDGGWGFGLGNAAIKEGKIPFFRSNCEFPPLTLLLIHQLLV